MYYLYQHIRKDKNEIFYIGIGTKNNDLTKPKEIQYRRAFEKVKSRNPYWKNIINITEYEVEIVYETNSREKIENEEIKRIALHKETLCNLTEGGKGIKSYSHTSITKQRISNSTKGKRKSKNHIINMNKRKNKPVIAIKEDQYFYFSSRKEACIKLHFPLTYAANITRSIKSGYKVKGYLFKEITDIENKESL